MRPSPTPAMFMRRCRDPPLLGRRRLDCDQGLIVEGQHAEAWALGPGGLLAPDDVSPANSRVLIKARDLVGNPQHRLFLQAG